jgi:methionyl-tRNA formyltransferase
MKIIYMGTPDFAIRPLQAILDAGYDVLAIATQPDKQKGRGREIKYSPVKEFAVSQGLPVLQPRRIKTAEAITELQQYDADIYVVFAYGQILSAEILGLPRYGCINIHASLLPRYRGAAPIQRAIIEGEEETGVTIMQMDAGIDTGDMLLVASLPIDAKETSDSLHERLSMLGAELIVETLAKIEKGGIIGIKQNDDAATYAPMIDREEGRIDWKMPAVFIERLVRGLNSRPGAYTYYQGKNLKIWAADSVSSRCENHSKPGTIIEATKAGIIVVCGEGSLSITELQLEGKKKMLVKDFLLGHKISVGEVLMELEHGSDQSHNIGGD